MIGHAGAALIGHAGGWDELGIPIGLALAVGLAFFAAYRRSGRPADRCPACDSPLASGAEACRACGWSGGDEAGA